MGISPSDFQQTLNKYMDFHRTYLFRVLFFNKNPRTLSKSLNIKTPNIPFFGSKTISVNASASLNPNFITELIASSETPVSTSTQISVGWMGSKVKVAGKTDFQDWKVIIRDDAINVAHNYFQKWRTEVYDAETGGSESLEDVGYKREAILQLLTNHHGIIPIPQRVYTLHGIWPKDIGTIALDYSTENIATFPVTFSLDYFTFKEMFNVSALSGNANVSVKIS